MWIGRDSWVNDGLGWRGPNLSTWTHQGVAPDRISPSSVGHANCLGPVRIGGVDLKTYEFVLRGNASDYIETLTIDATSGLPVRYDVRPDGGGGVNYQTTYRHDPALKLDPPVVDLDKRHFLSMQRLSDAIAQSDPACRREVLAMIRRGTETAFEYSLNGSFGTGVRGIDGIFSPPRSLYRRIEGAPFHGGGNELIAVEDDAWTKSESRDWSSDNGMRASADRVIDDLAPRDDHIGNVECLGSMMIDGKEYSVYHYDFYGDEKSAVMRGGMRRVFVDVATQLPARVEHSTNFGPRSELRHYNASLSVRAPKVAAPVLPPAAPFDEFRRRLLEQ